jgi:hypothetical protein
MKPTKYCLKKQGRERGRRLKESNKGDKLVQSILYAIMELSK